MSLPDYNRKRRFNQTPEPEGKLAARDAAELQFVIQKHQASHLHYDFRLELDGALKSWAVPKGLSLNPAVKRLAMMVEDHPFDYKDFEGIIPDGNYGAGTVIIWDAGTYEPVGIESGDPEEIRKYIRYKLHKGELKFRLHGEKLQGEFVILKNRNAEQDNAWLIYKVKDEFSSREDVTRQDRSVISGRTLEEVAESSDAIWESNRKSSRTGAKKKRPSIPGLELAKKLAQPPALSPMLATLHDEPFDSPDWIFEIKWDGYRALATLQDGKATLTSRKNISLNKFYPVQQALQQLGLNAVLDGEIIVLDDEGTASFGMLQSWVKEEKGLLCYQVFDLLWYEGYDLTGLPLMQRKKILEQILPVNDVIRYCDHINAHGNDFYNLTVKWGIEGIIAKKADSTYASGVRSKSWLKIKNVHRMEAVIAGFTAGRRSRKYFGALVLGKYEQGKLQYIGHTGSGMDDKTIRSLYEQLKPLTTKECPFEKEPKTNMPATWVRPELVCEIKYQEITKDGILRIPIFLGLRKDKSPAELQQEAVHLEKLAAEPKVSAQQKKKAAPGGLLIPDKKKELTILINNRELQLTNLEKLYWPDEKISKRDMLNYYHQVTPYMLAYMKDRPQSLNRHPNGIHGKSFYQKDVGGKVAGWLTTHEYISDNDGSKKDFLVCTDEASLLYIANLGCIEMNPWHSRTDKPGHPDWCVIDLDPDDTPFEKVIQTALVVKEVLDSVGVKSYCKTSGSTGLHIYVPLGARYTYDQSRMFAELIANMVHHELPKFTSVERSPAKRRGLIYIDYLQNRSIQTIAAPYSLRPKPGATASAPLDWSEVKKGLSIGKFHIHNMNDRIRDVGDLFAGVIGPGIELGTVLEKLLQLNG